MKNLRIILASASPRRKQLLEQLGWHFEVVRPDADETIFPGEKPELLVERLSQIKGAAVAKAHPDALVIASDTVVVSPQGMIFGSRRTLFRLLTCCKCCQGVLTWCTAGSRSF